MVEENKEEKDECGAFRTKTHGVPNSSTIALYHNDSLELELR